MTARGRRPLDERIALKYGAGGGAMRALIEQVFAGEAPPVPPPATDDGRRAFGLDALDDGAAIPVPGGWLVITTDSHVIQPIEFPGGDIGRLAVSGTVNDLAVMGATGHSYLTLAVIVEEGFPRERLERIQASVRATCAEAEATVVAGDTKVMGRGEVDGLVLNTTGVALAPRVVRDGGLRPGDRLIVSGAIGAHGFAVLATRGGLSLDAPLASDVAPVKRLVRRALEAGEDGVVAMKDPTRGGLASALTEMAEKAGVGILLEEEALPVPEPVRAASELLGIDPLHVANEGKVVLGVDPERAEAVLAAIRELPEGREAALVGRCLPEHAGSVILDTGLGRRLVTELEGEPLPRIC